MNSKLLYAATVAVSLLSLSTLALAADEAPVTRAQVNAELAKARADGTLQRTDYDADKTPVLTSTKTRQDVVVEYADNQQVRRILKGPDANRDYNPFGTDIYLPSTLARAKVKAEVVQAQADGTLQRTDYDDPALVARNVQQHTASAQLAQRIKAKFSRKQS